MIKIKQINPNDVTLKDIMDGKSRLYYICKTYNMDGTSFTMKAISDITNMQGCGDVTFLQIYEAPEIEADVIPRDLIENLTAREEKKDEQKKEYFSRAVYKIDKTIKGLHKDLHIFIDNGSIRINYYSKSDAEFYREKIWQQIYNGNRDFATCSDIYELFGIADYNKNANKYGWYTTKKGIVSDIRKKKNINIWSMTLDRPEQI